MGAMFPDHFSRLAAQLLFQFVYVPALYLLKYIFIFLPVKAFDTLSEAIKKRLEYLGRQIPEFGH